MNNDTPYANLTPNTLLDAIDGQGLCCDGRLLQLNSFENRVYQVGFDDGSYRIAKFYRPKRWSDAAILEEHAFTRELAQDEIPVVSPLIFAGHTLHHANGHRFALFAKQGGRPPELEQSETLEWLGRFLGRIHCIGEREAFRARPSIDLDSFGTESRDFLLAGRWLPAELQASWTSAVDLALDCVAETYQRAGNIKTLRLHGDCHPGNLLWTDDGPHFVDFDDSRTGPSIQDLWMLLSGEEQEMRQQLTALLTGYETFRDFDDRELFLIEPLRTLRLLHYSAWIARRWHDPAFPAAFPWFGSVRYWQDRILELKEQIALMQAPSFF
ncbi:serine/threonine protein kinase [Propionivibrio dicarboxylicus]|uniref:Stress response kinase A n=1 Tax=Propionivibrio dicarboxylicus TaxID=83767 RepID=A0A1G7ZRI2_9RHOO|nr:serine/threonine protein kinase [Propionivibrio dicarboxylicus]SDH11299.1 Ser/Thr protein kinase RdoA involved in Cpx stress response, MazF antagonist [Propionivibrio dicarboxylicus]